MRIPASVNTFAVLYKREEIYSMKYLSSAAVLATLAVLHGTATEAKEHVGKRGDKESIHAQPKPTRVLTEVTDFAKDVRITPVQRSVPVGKSATFRLHYESDSASGEPPVVVSGCDGELSDDGLSYTFEGKEDCTIVVDRPDDEVPVLPVKTIPTPHHVVLSGYKTITNQMCTWLNEDGSSNRIPNWSASWVEQVSGIPAYAYKVNWRTYYVDLPLLEEGESILEFRCYAPDRSGVIWPTGPLYIQLLAHPKIIVKASLERNSMGGWDYEGLRRPVELRTKEERRMFVGKMTPAANTIDEVHGDTTESVITPFDLPGWAHGQVTPAAVYKERGKYRMWVNTGGGVAIAQSPDGSSWSIGDEVLRIYGDLKGVIKDKGLYFLYYLDGSGNMHVAQSNDGVTILQDDVIALTTNGGSPFLGDLSYYKGGFAITKVKKDDAEYFLAVVTARERIMNGSTLYFVSKDGITFQSRWRTAVVEMYPQSRLPVELITVTDEGKVRLCAGHRKYGGARPGHLVCAEQSLPERVFQEGELRIFEASIRTDLIADYLTSTY